MALGAHCLPGVTGGPPVCSARCFFGAVGALCEPL